jgi:hypothetical protein
MEEMNLLETQLRSWELRRPSARLRQRLFPAPAGRLEFAWALRWFAPAGVCLLLALWVFYQQDAVPGGSFRSQPMIALIASNQSSVTGLPGSVQRAVSNFCPVTFEWTNRAGTTSSIGSFLQGKMTN